MAVGITSAAKNMKFVLVVGFFMVILGQLVPFFGSTFETAQGDLPADSQWNQSYNTDLPNVADIWGTVLTTVGAGLSLLAIIVIAAPFVGDMFGGSKKGGM